MRAAARLAAPLAARVRPARPHIKSRRRFKARAKQMEMEMEMEMEMVAHFPPPKSHGDMPMPPDSRAAKQIAASSIQLKGEKLLFSLCYNFCSYS